MRVLLLLIALSAYSYSASGQTRCPHGVRMGDSRCMPDPVYAPDAEEESEQPVRQESIYASRYGAIAVDLDDGRVMAAEDKSSEVEAFNKALNGCIGGRNTNRCTVIAGYKNACIALAWPNSPGALLVAEARITISSASEAAMSSCVKDGVACTIVYTGCAVAREM